MYEEFSCQNMVARLKDVDDEITSSDEKLIAIIQRDTSSGMEKLFFSFGCTYSSAEEQTQKIKLSSYYSLDFGWKFHISLEETQENIADAWDILKDIFIAERIHTTKVVRPGADLTKHDKQCGKQVTIYAFHNPAMEPKDWSRVINKITVAFVERGIRPGYPCVGTPQEPEYQVKNSSYFYYRYDSGLKSRSLTSQSKLSVPKEDPYSEIIVDIEGQLLPLDRASYYAQSREDKDPGFLNMFKQH